jgi:peptidyl-Lys metalloendopeptidase
MMIREQSFNPVLKYQLSAQSSYIVGKPIIIKFTLYNLSDANIWLLTWYTPLEGLKGKIFLVTCDGKEIPHEGRMVKRGDPTRDDYIHVVPKGSVSTEVDLSSAYKIPICDECRVGFKGRIYDMLGNEDYIPQKRDEHRWVDIQGNSVVFRIFPKMIK